MSFLVRNSLLMARCVVTSSFISAHSSSSSPRVPTKITRKQRKSWRRSISYYIQFPNHLPPFPLVVPPVKDAVKEEVKDEIENSAALFRSKMVRTEVPFAKSCIEMIKKRVVEISILENEDRMKIFEELGYIVIIDASRSKNGHAAAVAIVLSKYKLEPEVLVFLAESVKSDEAEQIPIHHLLENRYKRALIVTDQEFLVSAWENKQGSKRNELTKSILSAMDKSPESRLKYIPSKEFGLYLMCDITCGPIARLSHSPCSEEETEKEMKKICAKLEKINIEHTFRSLLEKL